MARSLAAAVETTVAGTWWAQRSLRCSAPSTDSWGGSHWDASRYLYVNMFVNSCTVFLGEAVGGLEITSRIICCNSQMANGRATCLKSLKSVT